MVVAPRVLAVCALFYASGVVSAPPRQQAPRARPAANARSPQRNAHRLHKAKAQNQAARARQQARTQNKKPVGPAQQEINKARFRADDIAAATVAARNLSGFCADPPRRVFKQNAKTIQPGPRSVEVDCFARFHEADLTVRPGDAAAGARMQRQCCNDKKRHGAFSPAYIVFPRSHLEAAMFYANGSARDVDVNFMGRLHTKQETANRARRWIFDFVRSSFTNASIFIDTTVQDPRTYKRLGPYDISIGADGRPAGFKPMGVMAEQTKNPCVMAKCSTDYFLRLARSRFTLSPAGDKPWSQRFFEAIMAGSIPLLDNKEHSGRNYKEKMLGYKYLLVSEYVARRRRFPGAAPYCQAWAEHNLDIFLRHQTYIMRRQTIHPNLERCIAEAF